MQIMPYKKRSCKANCTTRKLAEMPITVLHYYLQGPFPDKLLYNTEYLQSSLKLSLQTSRAIRSRLCFPEMVLALK